ncbi:MAG: hypothetical protein K2P20_05030, partial [Oscillospiraceae bacterium]|nr:hypothetical protein [Oscillospiraceae bacterium]
HVLDFSRIDHGESSFPLFSEPGNTGGSTAFLAGMRPTISNYKKKPMACQGNCRDFVKGLSCTFWFLFLSDIFAASPIFFLTFANHIFCGFFFFYLLSGRKWYIMRHLPLKGCFP